MLHLTSGLSPVMNVAAPSSPLTEILSTPLLKTEHITVVRIFLPAGKGLPPHHAKGDLVVLCLNGEIEFTAGSEIRTLLAGQLIALAGRETHSLVAAENSTILVTVAA